MDVVHSKYTQNTPHLQLSNLPNSPQSVSSTTKPSEISQSRHSTGTTNSHSLLCGISQKSNNSDTIPTGKKSIWTSIKEVTQRMLTFSDKCDDKPPKVKSRNNVSNISNSNQKLEEIKVPAAAEVPFGEFLRLDSPKSRSITPQCEGKRPKDVQINNTLQSIVRKSKGLALANIKSECKPAQPTDAYATVLLIKKDINDLYAKSGLQEIVSWEMFERLTLERASLVDNNTMLIYCYGFPILRDLCVPRFVGCYIAEVLVHVFSIRYGKLSTSSKISNYSTENWSNQHVRNVMDPTVAIPDAFSNCLHQTMFAFGRTSIQCKVAMNDKLIADLSLSAPKGLCALQKIILSSNSVEDHVLSACKLIAKVLKTESSRIEQNHQENVDMFCKNSPLLCLVLGKCLVELGKNAQLLFMNMEGNCFIAVFDKIASSDSENITKLKEVLEEASAEAIGSTSHPAFSVKSLLYLMVILKAHVVECYRRLWSSNWIQHKKYPRLTRVFIHSLYNLHKSKGGLQRIKADKIFKTVWSGVKDVFLEAFILDACENIESSSKWADIVNVMRKCQVLGLRDELEIECKATKCMSKVAACSSSQVSKLLSTPIPAVADNKAQMAQIQHAIQVPPLLKTWNTADLVTPQQKSHVKLQTAEQSGRYEIHTPRTPVQKDTVQADSARQNTIQFPTVQSLAKRPESIPKPILDKVEQVKQSYDTNRLADKRPSNDIYHYGKLALRPCPKVNALDTNGAQCLKGGDTVQDYSEPTKQVKPQIHNPALQSHLSGTQTDSKINNTTDKIRNKQNHSSMSSSCTGLSPAGTRSSILGNTTSVVARTQFQIPDNYQLKPNSKPTFSAGQPVTLSCTTLDGQMTKLTNDPISPISIQKRSTPHARQYSVAEPRISKKLITELKECNVFEVSLPDNEQQKLHNVESSESSVAILAKQRTRSATTIIVDDSGDTDGSQKHPEAASEITSPCNKKPRKRKRRAKNRFIVAPELLKGIAVSNNFTNSPPNLSNGKPAISAKVTNLEKNDFSVPSDTSEGRVLIKSHEINTDTTELLKGIAVLNNSTNAPPSINNDEMALPPYSLNVEKNESNVSNNISGERVLLKSHEMNADNTDISSNSSGVSIPEKSSISARESCVDSPTLPSPSAPHTSISVTPKSGSAKKRAKTNLKSSKGKSKLVMSLEGRYPLTNSQEKHNTETSDTITNEDIPTEYSKMRKKLSTIALTGCHETVASYEHHLEQINLTQNNIQKITQDNRRADLDAPGNLKSNKATTPLIGNDITCPISADLEVIGGKTSKDTASKLSDGLYIQSIPKAANTSQKMENKKNEAIAKFSSDLCNCARADKRDVTLEENTQSLMNSQIMDKLLAIENADCNSGMTGASGRCNKEVKQQPLFDPLEYSSRDQRINHLVPASTGMDDNRLPNLHLMQQKLHVYDSSTTDLVRAPVEFLNKSASSVNTETQNDLSIVTANSDPSKKHTGITETVEACGNQINLGYTQIENRESVCMLAQKSESGRSMKQLIQSNSSNEAVSLLDNRKAANANSNELVTIHYNNSNRHAQAENSVEKSHMPSGVPRGSFSKFDDEQHFLGLDLYHAVLNAADTLSHEPESKFSDFASKDMDNALANSQLLFSLPSSSTQMPIKDPVLLKTKKTMNSPWATQFLEHFMADPMEQFIAEHASDATQTEEPFTVVPTSQLLLNHTKNSVGNVHNQCSKHVSLNSCIFGSYPHMIPKLPDNTTISVGEYTFGLSTATTIAQSTRDGVSVFVGYDRHGGAVAAKQCLRRSTLPLTQILGPMNKSNLVRLLDINLHNPRSLVMVMELCECNLKTFMTLDAYKEHRMPMKKRMCFEFLSGLNVLHANNIVHSNIKPENVFIGKDSILKIGDYPVVSNWCEFMRQLACNDPERLCWEATEVKKRLSNYSAHKSDIQASGMLLHYILCEGMHPFGSLSSPISVDSNIRAGQYSIHTTDTESRHLLSWMLPTDPKIRNDTNICLTHPFFWSRKKQVQFLAAVGRQPEIRSGFNTTVLGQINKLAEPLNIDDWNEKIEQSLLTMPKLADRQYGSTLGDLLKFVSDIHDIENMPDGNLSLEVIGGDIYSYLSARFAACVLPIYEIVIKSPLSLKPQLEEVIHMNTKSWNAF